MSDLVYDLVYIVIHFQPLGGYVILGEYDTQEEAQMAERDLLIREPEAFSKIVRAPRGPTPAPIGGARG